MNMKPILFNTEMVRAILDGRKTVTRRVVKPRPPATANVMQNGQKFAWAFWEDGERHRIKPPYDIGDVLYVRETWFYETHMEDLTDGTPDLQSGRYSNRYIYKADSPDYPVFPGKWHPSIHMPKEAARLFLRVTDVQMERLQDITEEQALCEGMPDDCDYPLENPVYCPTCRGSGFIGAVNCFTLWYMEVECPFCGTPTKRFSHLWDSTIKPADCDRYGWDANPWVWVIEFDRVSKEDGLNG